VYCAVRADCLCVMQDNFRVEGVQSVIKKVFNEADKCCLFIWLSCIDRIKKQNVDFFKNDTDNFYVSLAVHLSITLLRTNLTHNMFGL
jgi:hypothetical protein